MALPDAVIDDIVARCHLQAAGAEGSIHFIICNHRNFTSDQRNANGFSQPGSIAFIAGCGSNGHITHDGFRAGGGYGDKIAAIGRKVFNVIEVAVFLFVDYFFIAEGCKANGIPVHHTCAPVNQAFAIKINENIDYGIVQGRLHGKARAIPVAAGAEFLELFQDDTAVFMGPLPGVFKKLLAGEVALADTFFGQHAHHLSFGGNARVVGSRNPAGIFPFHARLANQHILDGIVEHVAHVQNAGDIGRRYDDGIGFALIGNRAEQTLVHPVLIPFVFYPAGIVCFVGFHANGQK